MHPAVTTTIRAAATIVMALRAYHQEVVGHQQAGRGTVVLPHTYTAFSHMVQQGLQPVASKGVLRQELRTLLSKTFSPAGPSVSVPRRAARSACRPLVSSMQGSDSHARPTGK